MGPRKTATKTAETTEEIADEAQSKGEVAIFQPPRLPYHNAIEEKFGVNKGQWKVLVEAIFPAAKSVDAIVMALSYCQQRNLDPFKRPVHIVPMYDSARGGYVETVWPGISELRTTASRTKGYAGCDEAQFGEEVTEKFTGRVKRDGAWKDEAIEVTFPAWCRITVYRIVDGQRCKFVGPKVAWLETYATQGASSLPNKMWQERPEGQLEKCAEAAALRRAFPEEIGNDLTAEEMVGRNVHDVVTTVEPVLIVDHARDTQPPREPKAAEQAAPPRQDAASEARDAAPPRTAPKPDPISSGPQRDVAPPRQATAPAKKDDGPSDPGPQPHQIPGTGETFESWCAKYCDLIKTSLDTATVYKWIDLNHKPLERLQKGKPSEYAKAKKAAEETMERLKTPEKPKASPKAAPAQMDEMDDGPGDSGAGDTNPEDILKRIDEELAAVEDPDQLQSVWDSAIEPMLKDLFPPDVDEAQALFRKHEKRLGA
jgi:phage recombination protein Bet